MRKLGPERAGSGEERQKSVMWEAMGNKTAGFLGNVAKSFSRGADESDLDILTFEVAMGWRDWDEVRKLREDFKRSKKTDPLEGNAVSQAAYTLAEEGYPALHSAGAGAMAAWGVAKLNAATPLGATLADETLAGTLGAAQYLYRKSVGAKYAAAREKGASHKAAATAALALGILDPLLVKVKLFKNIPWVEKNLPEIASYIRARKKIVNGLKRVGNAGENVAKGFFKESGNIVNEETAGIIDSINRGKSYTPPSGREWGIRLWEAGKKEALPSILKETPGMARGISAAGEKKTGRK
jgi:hypothetical protein